MLHVRDIHKTYEGEPLLTGVSFDVGADETVALLGASGSGKSTLLQIIAGLETAERGTVLWEARDLSAIAAHRRDFGLVFQDYALFPHMDVFSNVAFGLRMKRWPAGRIRGRVQEVLSLVNLDAFERRSVTELSGGEQQRVALARALAPQPRLLMFDEPLAALDRALREELQAELRRILRRSDLPAIYVTHDQDEAFAMGDRVLLLHGGKIVAEGTPQRLAGNPGSAWVAGFLGLGTVVRGVIRKVETQGATAETEFGLVEAAAPRAVRVGQDVPILIRPEEVTFTQAPQRPRFVVRDVVFQRDHYRVVLENGLFGFAATPPPLGSMVSVEIRHAEILQDA